MPITIDYTVPPGPTVVSIARADANPTSAASVSWTVTFSESVTGVSAANFGLTTALSGTPAINSVTGSGTTWTVTASTGSGDGSLQLDMVNSTGVTNGNSEAVTGLPFAGEVYTIDRTAPTVNAVARADANPTDATTVAWTVTFSESVTGLSTTNFTLSSTLPGTPAILSVTGSGTTWTVTASTGSGTGTLGLNMVNSTGAADAMGNPVSNVPFTGETYDINSDTRCLTQDFPGGVLDTSIWDVRTIKGPFLPQVIDAGGGDYRLRLTDTQNNEATFAQIKRSFPGFGNKIVMEIDYFSFGGTGADGIAMTLSDSSIVSTTGGYGGSLGYAQNTAGTPSAEGFGGGWLGIGLDEWGNFPNPTEGRQGYPVGWTPPPGADIAAGFYKTNVSVRGSGSGFTGYPLLANTGVLATPVAPASGAAGATPYRYRFTVDHSDNVHAYVTVERDTTAPLGDSYQVLMPTFDAKAYAGQAAVPPRWLVSFTGSTGGSTNNHDFKRVKVCANTISTSMSGPDHFEIEHASGTGLTCNPTTLTIKACEDVGCTIPYTAGVNGSLSVTNVSGTPTVNWGGGTSFSIPAGASSVTKDVHVTTVGTLTFDATSPDVASPTTCNFGGTPSCDFTAADTGLLISAPNHVADAASTLTVQAVKKADNSLQCAPAFGGQTKTVNLKCAYVNPSSGTWAARVAGQALNAANDAGAACDLTGASVNLSFDATGTATASLQYADVGKLTITGSLSGTTGALDEGLSMSGSGEFITRPDHFTVTAPGNPGGSGPTDGVFTTAGSDFQLEFAAVNASGIVTPNFGKESPAETVNVNITGTSPNLLAPSGGAIPDLTVASAPVFGTNCAGNTAGGYGCGTYSWPEVGAIEVGAQIANANYLAAGGNVPALTTSGAIGRFIPASFAVADNGPSFAPGCGGFTYLDQPFTYAVAPQITITARNAAGGTTTNYTGTWCKLGIANALNNFAVANAGLPAGVTVADAPAPAPAPGFAAINCAGANGVVTTTLNGTYQYSRAAATTAPFNAAPNVSFTVADGDAVSGGTYTLAAVPFTGGANEVRSGRAYAEDVYGTAGAAGDTLTMPLVTQYYNAAGSWVQNAADSCSSVGYTKAEATITTALASPGAAAFAAGTASLPITVTGDPDATPGGSTVVTFDWTNGGIQNWLELITTPAAESSPSATATFGVYRGDRRIIHWREEP